MLLDTDRITTDDAYREDLRHRFLTDHFFAAELIGFNDFSRRAHGPAVALYGPKNPNLPISMQPRKKKIIHMDPRHTFKTTLKRVDRAMWIAAFPEEISIVNNSATQPLAEAVSIATANLFYIAPGEAPTPLQLIFPQLCTYKDPQSSPNKMRWVWNAPGRRRTGAGDLDSTLAYTSPKSTQSGWHPFIMDYDDVEDTNNSGIGVDEEVRQHVIDVCDQNENLLRDGGYISIGGTRYHPFDWYGKQIEMAKDNPDEYDILVRSSVRVKAGARLVPGEFPEEDELELLWPEYANLSYRSLRTKFHQNYESFMCQQQNDPQGGSVPTFTERLYQSCIIAADRVPHIGHMGETFTCWRLPYGGKRNMAKNAEGAAAKIIDGKVYIIDAWITARTPTSLAEFMVQKQKEVGAEGMLILETPGSEFMAAHLRNEAARRNLSMKVQWTWWEENDEIRAAKIKQLEPLMNVGRMMFSTAISRSIDCHRQFVHFGLVPENGIAECVSTFASMVPMSQLRANMQEEEIQHQRRQRDNAAVSHFLDQMNMPGVDEQAQRQANAHLAAMQAATESGKPAWLPPLPGGLDG